MADWPTVAQVKLSLGVSTDTRDDLISTALQASIEQVGYDLGYHDVEVDEESPDGYVLVGVLEDPDEESEPVVEIVPTNSLSTAALVLAVMAVKAPDSPYGIVAAFDLGAVRVASQHPTYTKLLTGHRQRFGVA